MGECYHSGIFSTSCPTRSRDKANKDGTRFKWFDIRSFPPEPPLVVAKSA